VSSRCRGVNAAVEVSTPLLRCQRRCRVWGRR
jgi:hypothetical protein